MCHNVHTLALGETHLTGKKDTILVASWDPVLADVRKTVLEKEGFAVLQARGSAGVRELCKKKRLTLSSSAIHCLPPKSEGSGLRRARRAKPQSFSCVKVGSRN